jgi:uncharacterized protein (DUF2344 family)
LNGNFAKLVESEFDVDKTLEYIDSVAKEYNLVGRIRKRQNYLKNYKINDDGEIVFYTTKSGKRVTLYFKSKFLTDKLSKSLEEETNHGGWNRKKIITCNLTDDDKLSIKELLCHVSTVDSSVKKKCNF